jgi:hypothetical protein
MSPIVLLNRVSSWKDMLESILEIGTQDVVALLEMLEKVISFQDFRV